MNKWLVIAVIAVIVVGVFIWISSRDQLGLSPVGKSVSKTGIMGKAPVPMSSRGSPSGKNVFGVPA